MSRQPQRGRDDRRAARSCSRSSAATAATSSKGTRICRRSGPYLRLVECQARSGLAGALGDQPAPVSSEDAHAQLHVQARRRPKPSPPICSMPARRTATQWLASHGRCPTGIDPERCRSWWRTGKEIVDSVGCRGCHGFAEGESPALLGAEQGHRAQPQPRRREDRRALDVLLGEGAARLLARVRACRACAERRRGARGGVLPAHAWARSSRTRSSTRGCRIRKRSRHGKALVRKYGCFGCHDIPGMENESRIGVELLDLRLEAARGAVLRQPHRHSRAPGTTGRSTS